MPIYVYEREDGTTFETIQRITEEALNVCPETGQKVIRQISASTPIFKGSGFYKTDYCGSSTASKKGSESKKGADSTSSSEGSSGTESKPKGCGTGCGCH